MYLYRILLDSKSGKSSFFVMDVFTSHEQAKAMLAEHVGWQTSNPRIVMVEVVLYELECIK